MLASVMAPATNAALWGGLSALPASATHHPLSLGAVIFVFGMSFVAVANLIVRARQRDKRS
jgi:hypothetical protein